jgi:hypothetical protein
MKIKVLANELVDTDIEMVSLVKHGANRCPFKVLKAEDSEPPTIRERLSKLLDLSTDTPKIVAFFIRKGAEISALPILRASGFENAVASEMDGAMVVPVREGEVEAIFQLSDDVAVGMDREVPTLSKEAIVKAHADRIGTGGIYPSLGQAFDALATDVWNLLNTNSESPVVDRVEKVDHTLISFRKYLDMISKTLPDEVFKIEGALRSLNSNSGNAGTSDMPTSKAKLTEAVAGDLDGLETPITKADSEPDDDETAEDNAVVAAGEAAPESEDVKKDEAPKPPADASPEPKAEATDGTSSPDAVLNVKVVDALTQIAAVLKSVQADVAQQRDLTKRLETQVADVANFAKAVEERVTTTPTIVNKSDDLDLALSSLGGASNRSRRTRGEVEKGDYMGDSLWDGLFKDLDSFRNAR